MSIEKKLKSDRAVGCMSPENQTEDREACMTISAIVPVYNTEKQVGRCIDSIIAQTYPNWELILVDDGSTDRSLDVIREYKKKGLSDKGNPSG